MRKIFFHLFIGETVISVKMRDAIKISQPVHCSFLHITIMGGVAPTQLLHL